MWNIIEAIIRGFLAFKVFPDSNIDEKITQFLPLESMANLIVNPGPRLSVVKTIGSQMGINTDIDYSVSYCAILIVLAWTFLFIYFSYKLLKNRDL